MFIRPAERTLNDAPFFSVDQRPTFRANVVACTRQRGYVGAGGVLLIAADFFSVQKSAHIFLSQVHIFLSQVGLSKIQTDDIFLINMK